MSDEEPSRVNCPCPLCGESFTLRGLGVHLSRKHPLTLRGEEITLGQARQHAIEALQRAEARRDETAVQEGSAMSEWNTEAALRALTQDQLVAMIVRSETPGLLADLVAKVASLTERLAAAEQTHHLTAARNPAVMAKEV